MTTSRAPIAVAVTVVLWACAFPAIRVAVPGLGVAGLSLARLTVASVVLAVAAPVLGVRRPRAADLPLTALCGAAGMSAYQLLLNWGEVHVPAGTASLLVAVAPAFSVLLAIAFLGERLTRARLLGSALALAGSAVIAVAGGNARFSTSALVVLAAAVVQGVYHVATKPLLRRYTSLEVACYAMWAGTLFLLPLAPTTIGAVRTAPWPATVSAIFLGVLPSAVGFVAWGYGVARLSVTTATAALYLVPVVALAVAYVWLHETPGVVDLLGGLVGIAGVVLINRGTPRPRDGAARRSPNTHRSPEPTPEVATTPSPGRP